MWLFLKKKIYRLEFNLGSTVDCLLNKDDALFMYHVKLRVNVLYIVFETDTVRLSICSEPGWVGNTLLFIYFLLLAS